MIARKLERLSSEEASWEDECDAHFLMREYRRKLRACSVMITIVGDDISMGYQAKLRHSLVIRGINQPIL